MTLGTKIPQRLQEPLPQRGKLRARPVGAAERAASWIALVFMAAVVAFFTIGKAFVSFEPLWTSSVHRQRSINLVLFNGFDHPSVWWGPWTNLFGNIGLFLPVGFLLVVLLRGHVRFPVFGALVVSAAASLAIETAQYVLAAGYSDVDDLLFNTIGGAIGALLAARMGPRWRALTIGFLIACSAGCLALMLGTRVF